MCGINGFNFYNPDRLRAMHQATRHRGPDDEGFFQTDRISLAHNRLSIIDLSPAGHQPMMTPDQRFTIVFNGEIYNYQELRTDLERLGIVFHSHSDTEVLLQAFVQWGEDCLAKLNGIFAFAIWDRDQERLTLVRDQVGVKPLYYWWDGKRLIFSSEIKALLEHGLPREIDREALNLYFRFLYVPAPRTMFRGIYKLEPGSIATLEKGKFSVRRWWSLTEGEYISSYAEAQAGLRDRVRQAVRRQLVSDRPLGVFLSGGVDSSIVLAAMHAENRGPIKTFSMDYASEVDQEKYSADARLAELTARHFGTEHHTYTMTAQDAMNCFEKVAWHMDEPVSNHVQSSTYLLAQYVKPEITVALGGDGGDELFGGYSRYWYSAMIDRVRWLPVPWQNATLTRLVNRYGKRDLWDKMRTLPGCERHLAFVMQKEDMVRRFLRPEISTSDIASRTFASFFDTQWRDRTNQLMAVDVTTWLPEESLMRTDKLTMAHGLEERVPLLDPDLVAYAFRIPSRFKLGTRTQGKRILVDAMRDLLPPHVLHQEKRAWMSPAAKWLRGPMLGFAREVLSPSFCPVTQDLFDFEEIQRILNDHVEKRFYALNTIWSLMTFQVWAQSYLFSSSQDEIKKIYE